MNADLEAIVATAVRDGFTIESRTSTTVTLTKRPASTTPLVLGRIAVISFFAAFGVAMGRLAPVAYVFLLIPLAVIVLWVVAARKQTRIQIYVNDQGEVVQDRARA